MFGFFRHSFGRHCHPYGRTYDQQFYDEQHDDARLGAGGGYGRHRRGFGFGQHGGPGGDGREFGATGRKFSAADLQLLILAMLEQQPSHGYELIKGLDERSGGYYVPSPGVIYPALSYLEEIGYAEVALDGTKKLYNLTDAGREHLTAHRAAVDAMFEQLARAGERMARVREAMQADDGADDWAGPRARGFGRRHELYAALHDLKAALRERFARGRASGEADVDAIIALLRDAAEAIRRR